MAANGSLMAPSASGKLHAYPSVLVIVVVLSVVLLCSGILHLLARCLGRRPRGALVPGTLALSNSPSAASNTLRGQLQHLFQLHDAGVDQALIDTLPVFLYGSIRGLKDGADCAVCLSEFGDTDRLRLLPKCKHAFHHDCIDTWLLSHSTCPLCRQSLLPGDSLRFTASSNNLGGRGSRGPQPPVPIHHTTSEAAGCAQAFAQEHDQSEGEISRSGSMLRSTVRACDPRADAAAADHNAEFHALDILPTNSDPSREPSSRMVTADKEMILQGSQLDHRLQASSSPDYDGMPSAAGPTVCVTEADGSERVTRVQLGKVKFESSGDYYGNTASSNVFDELQDRCSSSNRSSQQLAAAGRSYSMGSYQYIVDSSSFELTMAPTPYPGRPQLWGSVATPLHAGAAGSSTKPTHRSVLSDTIPELALSTSCCNTPANEDFFWARRGLNTPHSLSLVREMMTPSTESFLFSPAPDASSQASHELVR